MKALRVSLLIIMLSAAAFASPTFNCNQSVNDLAGVLGSKSAQVQQAASTLNSRGADTRIATVSLNGYASMDAWVGAAVKNCPSMQSPSGGVKSTLVVIAVAPSEHKMGIYTGKAFESAFGADRMLRYKTQFMGPRFKAGEWAEGLIAAAQQMSDRLAAYTSEVNTPVTNTTVNQASAPTDMHGLWVFFWIVGGCFFIGIIWWIFSAVWKSKEEGEEAQQSAIAARTHVTNLMSSLTSGLTAYSGNFEGHPGAARANAILDSISRQFSELAGQLSGDPTQEGLGVGTYKSLASLYSGLAGNLTQAMACLNNPDEEPSSAKYRSAGVPLAGSPKPSTPEPRRRHSHYHSNPQPAAPSNPTPQTNSNDGFVEGMVLGSVLNRPGYSEPERPYREPERSSEPERKEEFSSGSGSSDFSSPPAEPEPSHSFSNDSGSSPFSSDPSPSFSDSDSSSDFGDGGSNFGGGSGSSDF